VPLRHLLARRTRAILAVCTLAALAAAAVVSWAGRATAGPRPDGSLSPMERLAREAPGRVFAARLSIDLPYRPCSAEPAHLDSTMVRQPCGAADDQPLQLYGLASARSGWNPDSMRAAALTSMLYWDGADTTADAAVQGLRRAVDLAGDSVPLLVDLSAAYLVRAERTLNSKDLVVALESAERALLRDPRNVPALFNKALALEWMGVHEQAAKAWAAYLRVDSTSEWAAEARRRSRGAPPRLTLPEPEPGASAEQVAAFAAHDPLTARLLGTHRVLGAWGKALLKGDSVRAAAQLALAEMLGAALENRKGLADSSLADAVRSIRDASRSRTRTALLARAHVRWARAQKRLAEEDYNGAKRDLGWIVNATPPCSVLVQSARIDLAAVDRTSDTTAAFSVLRRADTARHPALAARAHWVRGNRLGKGNERPQAMAEHRAAGALFAGLGETEYQGAAASYAGEVAGLAADTLAAYQLLHRAVTLLRPYRESVRLHNALTLLGDIASRDGMPLAASALYQEDMAVATRVRGRPSVRFEALTARARMRMVSGDTAGARRDLDSADVFAKRTPAGAAQDWVTTVSMFRRLTVQRGGRRSRRAIDSVIRHFNDEPYWLVPALMLRSDARLAAGDTSGAALDSNSAMRLIRGPAGRADPRLQAAMMDRARERVDRLVMFSVNTRSNTVSLAAREQSRVSLQAGGNAAGRPRSRAGEAALVYSLIGDTLLIWTARYDTVHLSQRTVQRDSLLRSIERVGLAMESGQPDSVLLPRLAALYDLLIRPVAAQLGRPETPLVILADGEIAGVPFNALWDARRGRYLVEDHVIRHAATLADAALPPAKGDSSRPALFVADPAFDPVAHPTLERLRGAAAEVGAISGLHANRRVLQDTAATREQFVNAAQNATLIHYAGHAVFDDTRPGRSYLVLAKDTGDANLGRMTADSVDQLHLAGVRLVVLSACRTLRTRAGRSGGFAGLSGAMLRAGAGGVVGSLWEVNDTTAQPLMLRFHQRYAATGDPARSLRDAQLHMLRSRRSPAVWAGFRYAGR
jgi:CHAT domain-containing protein/tetratricopeptide (TPR) repeat protein